MPLHTVTIIRGERVSVDLSHEACSECSAGAPDVIAIRANPLVEPDTLSRVAIARPAGSAVLHLYWQANTPDSSSLGLAVVESSDMLFVGASSLVAAISLASGKRVHETQTELFWGFEFKPNSILARCELECMLFSYDGALVGRAPVDPPWEESESSDGIVFQSGVYGRQVLTWPPSAGAC